MTSPPDVLGDLTAESAELDAIVAALPDQEWARATPAVGWTIAHQIAHLAWTDERTRWSIQGEDAFASALAEVGADPQRYVDEGAAAGAALPPAELLARWRHGRQQVASGLAAVPRGVLLPWYGPGMGAISMATARLMETFAHGQDVRDSLGIAPPDTPRLRNVAHIAFRTRDFAYRLHDRTPPTAEFFLELTGPDGELWRWGDPASDQRVSAPALDFCLLATQRRHRDDTAVHSSGADADEWLTIIQAFAGPPGPGRGAGSHFGSDKD